MRSLQKSTSDVINCHVNRQYSSEDAAKRSACLSAPLIAAEAVRSTYKKKITKNWDFCHGCPWNLTNDLCHGLNYSTAISYKSCGHAGVLSCCRSQFRWTWLLVGKMAGAGVLLGNNCVTRVCFARFWRVNKSITLLSLDASACEWMAF